MDESGKLMLVFTPGMIKWGKSTGEDFDMKKVTVENGGGLFGTEPNSGARNSFKGRT